MIEYEYNEYSGITIQAIVARRDRRWTLWLIGGPWLEKDLRAELEDGTAFVIDEDDGRTNGIFFKQVKQGE